MSWSNFFSILNFIVKRFAKIAVLDYMSCTITHAQAHTYQMKMCSNLMLRNTGEQGCGSALIKCGSGYGSGSSIFSNFWSGSRSQCGSGFSSRSRVLMSKNWIKLTAGNFLYIFWSKIAIYLSLDLPKGRPGYRRSLQPSKENTQHTFKTRKFFTCLFLSVIFALPDPDPDSATQINAVPDADPDPQHCR